MLNSFYKIKDVKSRFLSGKNIYKIILLLILNSTFIIHHSTFSQIIPVIEWQKCLGGPDQDQGASIQQTSDGGYIVTGFGGQDGGNITGNHGDWDYWVVKLNSAGSMQWQKSLGGTYNDWAHSVRQTSDGGYIVAGTSVSNNGDVTGNHGSWDYWVVKLDAAGIIQWEHCYGGTAVDGAEAIIQTSDGGYAVAGEASSNDGDVTGHHGLGDAWVVKLDSVGIIQWQKCLGGPYTDGANSIQQTVDGGYIVAGSASANGGDVTNNHGDADFWVVKLDSAGNLQWQKSLGGSATDIASTVQQTADGGYVAGGYTLSSDGDVTGFHPTVQDAWVVKLDSAGTLQWQKCLGGSFNDYLYSICQTADGGYLAAATAMSNDGDLAGYHGIGWVWLVKLDSAGSIQWQKRYGGPDGNGEFANSIQLTSNGSYVVAGWTRSNNGDVSGNHGGNGDYWVVKLTEHFNAITGKLFVDGNSNGIQDPGEPPVTNKQVTEINTGRFAFSQPNGDYYASVLDSGNFSVYPAPVNYYNPVPVSYSSYFPGFNQTDSLNDFALQPSGVFNDLCITITPVSDFITGFNAGYIITYENVGTTIVSPTVIFFPGNDVTFVSANPAANSIAPDSAVWNFGPISPYQSGSILVTVNVTIGTPDGTLIHSTVRIEPLAGDANSVCNYDSSDVLTTSSYDPNEILVDRNTILTNELSNPPFLEYIIYFQNTGTATAFNVRVLNNIPARLDMNTFEFVSSSHPVTTAYNSPSRLMTFTFDNINLPDSNANEPASHGFIRYRIKPKTTLVAGDSIKNKAFIYFDFNAPVGTNHAVTVIVLPTSNPDLVFPSENRVTIVPVPLVSSAVLSFSNLSNEKFLFTLYDITGRITETISTITNEIILTKGSKQPGVYLFNLVNEKTGESVNGKIVIGER